MQWPSWHTPTATLWYATFAGTEWEWNSTRSLHYGRKGTGMLLVPGMTFTIEPMINEGDWEVCGDAEDPTEWIVLTEDGTDSAQWEHTYLMTENGVEILTH